MAGSTNKKAKKIAWVHCDLSKKFADSADFVHKSKIFTTNSTVLFAYLRV